MMRSRAVPLMPSEGRETRERAATAAARAINPGEFWDWPDAGPGVITQRELWQANGARAVDAAVPVVLDDIEALIWSCRQTYVASLTTLAGASEAAKWINIGVDMMLERIRKLRADNGWPSMLCAHCGAPPEADGDHSCPCPHRDEDCPDHPWARAERLVP